MNIPRGKAKDKPRLKYWFMKLKNNSTEELKKNHGNVRCFWKTYWGSCTNHIATKRRGGLKISQNWLRYRYKIVYVRGGVQNHPKNGYMVYEWPLVRWIVRCLFTLVKCIEISSYLVTFFPKTIEVSKNFSKFIELSNKISQCLCKGQYIWPK